MGKCSAEERVYSIKVRKPRVIKCFGFADLYERYSKRQYNYMRSLPNDGDKIKITWFPDNRGVTNAYIGIEGVVESMNKNEGSFYLNCDTCGLVCHGNFNYIKL